MQNSHKKNLKEVPLRTPVMSLNMWNRHWKKHCPALNKTATACFLPTNRKIQINNKKVSGKIIEGAVRTTSPFRIRLAFVETICSSRQEDISAAYEHKKIGDERQVKKGLRIRKNPSCASPLFLSYADDRGSAAYRLQHQEEENVRRDKRNYVTG